MSCLLILMIPTVFPHFYLNLSILKQKDKKSCSKTLVVSQIETFNREEYYSAVYVLKSIPKIFTFSYFVFNNPPYNKKDILE